MGSPMTLADLVSTAVVNVLDDLDLVHTRARRPFTMRFGLVVADHPTDSKCPLCAENRWASRPPASHSATAIVGGRNLLRGCR